MSAYLKDRDDIASRYQAESLSQALDYLTDNHVDVAIVDLALLKPSGLADVRQLFFGNHFAGGALTGFFFRSALQNKFS